MATASPVGDDADGGEPVVAPGLHPAGVAAIIAAIVASLPAPKAPERETPSATPPAATTKAAAKVRRDDRQPAAEDGASRASDPDEWSSVTRVSVLGLAVRCQDSRGGRCP